MWPIDDIPRWFNVLYVSLMLDECVFLFFHLFFVWFISFFLFVIVWFDQGLIHTLSRSEKSSYKLNVYYFFFLQRIASFIFAPDLPRVSWTKLGPRVVNKMADNEISGKRKRSKAFYVGQKRRVSPLLTWFKSNNFFFLKISWKPHLFAHFSEKRTRTSCARNERSACHV